MASVLPGPEAWAALAPTPGSPVWRAFDDARMLATAGYATLLQVAHPTVGHGVHQYSSFTTDPWGRLYRTLDYVHGTIYGGPRMAGELGARVRGIHRTIRGTTSDGERYSAMEPEAFAWVHATLVLGIVEGRRHLARPLTWPEQQALWTQWLDVGRLIGVRERDLPQAWGDARAYAERMIRERLRWTPAVPEVLDTLAASPPPNVPGMPDAIWRAMSVPLSAQLRVTAAGLMPPGLREELGLRFDARDRAAFGAFCAASRSSGPFLRGPGRTFGQSWVRWRREALARGDVAASARHEPLTQP